MKKILTTLALMMSLTCWADNVPALKIQTAQKESTILLKDISKVQYTETEMTVLMTDGTKQTFTMDDITAMAFDNVDDATALQSILGATGSKATVFDMGGRKVSATNQGGVYIIKMGKETKKVKK